MKKLTSNYPSGLLPILFCVFVTLLVSASSVTSLASIIDTSNPSELSEQDYANGGKRAADAASRVLPRLSREMDGSGIAVGNPVFIRIFKENRELEVWIFNKQSKKYQEFKKYRIVGMSGELGPKTLEGDWQAPEGFYTVGRGALNPQSRFHLSFNVGYPNAYDRAHGRTGHSIMVHGNEVSVGCFAMTDYYVEEIYTLCSAALGNGQGSISVHSFPFRMTDTKMKEMKDDQWYSFWKNLKAGYDVFEKNKVPPRVKVVGKNYLVT